VSASEPTIVATSIGFFSRDRGPYDWRVGPIFDHAADLANAGANPKLCFLGQATGDDRGLLSGVYAAFAGTRFRLSHLSLFPMPNVDDVRAHLLDQDVIWVGGGSVANLLAVWRAHRVDEILRECWKAGVVLGGVSAGSICWHVGGCTDSFGPELQPFTDGLGWLPYANGVHYDSEEQRRPLYRRFVAEGTLAPGYAADDGVGLHFVGTDFAEAVSFKPGAAAWRVAPAGPAEGSDAIETRIEPRLLS